jgi:hypothetical protein
MFIDNLDNETIKEKKNKLNIKEDISINELKYFFNLLTDEEKNDYLRTRETVAQDLILVNYICEVLNKSPIELL